MAGRSRIPDSTLDAFSVDMGFMFEHLCNDRKGNIWVL